MNEKVEDRVSRCGVHGGEADGRQVRRRVV
jgi:hypothetical protein